MRVSIAPDVAETRGRWRVAIPHALSAAALHRPAGELHMLDGETMGTSWRVTFVGASPTLLAARRAIVQVLDRVTGQLSPWIADSELNRFNVMAAGSRHIATAEFARVLTCALRIAEETGGACDPALGALVDLWGFGPLPRGAVIPSASEIAQALRASGWRHIAHDPIRNSFSRNASARLDLCGIAKGYAVDLVARLLRESGVAAALIEIGGELCGYGVKPDGTPWWVAVDGDAGSKAPILVALHGLAIATSGSERSFVHAGKSYSHTIDPRTGWPIDNGMISATVLHDSCMQADAYASALMVMGSDADAAVAFADMHGLAAVIRYRAGRDVIEQVSAQLQAMLDE